MKFKEGTMLDVQAMNKAPAIDWEQAKANKQRRITERIKPMIRKRKLSEDDIFWLADRAKEAENKLGLGNWLRDYCSTSQVESNMLNKFFTGLENYGLLDKLPQHANDKQSYDFWYNYERGKQL